MLNAIIIDDDELSRHATTKYIEQTDFMQLVGEFNSAIEALQSVDGLNCDIIFLDIEMPEMSGIEFIDQVKNIPQVIIASSYKEYAAEAFNYDVTDYLVKPIEYPRFLKAALKAKSIHEEVSTNNLDKDHLFFKKNNTHYRVNFSDICYVEAYADYVNVYTEKDRFTVLSTMKAIQQRFPEQDFMRIHRSYIIRLDKVNQIEENAVNVNGKVLPISRSYKTDFMKKVNIF